MLQPCVLLLGDSFISAVRRDDGAVVAELILSTSCRRVQSVVCGDVDSDGYSDIVLTCAGEYVVLSLSVHRGSSLFPRLLLCLLCALLAAVCAQLAILYSPALRSHVQRLEQIIIKRTAHAE